MINILYGKDGIAYKQIHYQRLNYIQTLVKNYLNIIDRYYSSSNHFVNRPNQLVTLIELLNIDSRDTVDNVVDHLENIGERLAGTLGFITSSEENSKPLKNTIMDNINEYILITEDLLIDTSSKILEEPSLYCTHSSLTDIFLTHPKKYDGHIDGDEYNVYNLNIVKLGLQYYYWSKNQLAKEVNNSTDEAKFVYEVVLKNVIESLTTQMFNSRIINIFKNEPVDDFENYNTFYIKDLTSLIDTAILWYKKIILKNNGITFNELLSKIPSFTSIDFHDSYIINDIYFTKRNKWVIWFTKLDLLNFLVSTASSKMNNDYISKIKIDLKRMSRSRYFEVDDTLTRYLLEEKINNLKDKL